MKQLLTILLLCCCGTAEAQTQVAFFDRTLVNNSTIFADAQTKTNEMLIITSEAPSPSDPIIGLGGRAFLTKMGTSISRFITTENWAGTPVEIQPTVIGISAKDGTFTMNDTPYGNATELAIASEVCDAIDINGDAPTVEGCYLTNWRGDAITIRNNTTETSAKVRIPRAVNNRISHCWIGVRGRAVDLKVAGNRIANVRDYGIYCTAGSEDLMDNHVFGATICIYMDGGSFNSIGDRFSDAPTGFFVGPNGAGSYIIGGKSEHCWQRNIYVTANRVNISNCKIQVANTSDEHPGTVDSGVTRISGIVLESDNAVVSDCRIETSGYTFPGDVTNVRGSCGIITSHNTIIDNLKLWGDADDGDNIAGETGVRVPAARTGGTYFIDASIGGYNDAGDEVLLFDDADNCTGIVAYVIYKAGDTPVTIPSGWSDTNKIYIRTPATATWTELTAGQPYP